jgi:ankyrin repeat protein
MADHYPDNDYTEAKTAQNFFREAVDFSLTGKLTELKKLINDYLRKDCNITAQELLVDFKSEGKTLVHVAATGGQLVIIEYLLSLLTLQEEKKELINLSDDRGFTPLINATISESDSIIASLILYGADVNAVNKDGAGAIHFAAGDGSVSRLTLLADAGANIGAMSQAGTPLHWAAGKGRIDTIKVLVDRGSDMNQLSSQGLPAVLMAAVGSSDEGVAYLVNKGADIGHNVAGDTNLLHISAEHGLETAVSAILKQETGLRLCKVETSDGNLPIHLAAMAGHKVIVDALHRFSLEKTSLSVEDLMADGIVRMADWMAKDQAKAKSAASLPIVPLPEATRVTTVRGKALEPTTPAISIEAEEESDLWKNKGNDSFSKKDYKSAIESYTKAIKLKGDSGALWSNRSACYLAMGRGHEERALADAETCRHLMPLWSKACYRLARARLALK